MKKYQPKFLKISTVASDLDYSNRTVRRWIDEGLIPAIKINGSWRIPAYWLFEHVEKLKNDAVETVLIEKAEKFLSKIKNDNSDI